MLLVAHYDAVPGAPGASDDGSGVVTLLETARALGAGPRLDNDVLFLFTDAEENGMLGAQAFVADVELRRDVALVLNFDARGSHGVVTMFDTSRGNGTLIRALGEVAPFPVASSFVSASFERPPQRHRRQYLQEGRAPHVFVRLCRRARALPSRHHSLATIDPHTIAHAGSYAVSLVQHFGGVETLRSYRPMTSSTSIRSRGSSADQLRSRRRGYLRRSRSSPWPGSSSANEARTGSGSAACSARSVLRRSPCFWAWARQACGG